MEAVFLRFKPRAQEIHTIFTTKGFQELEKGSLFHPDIWKLRSVSHPFSNQCFNHSLGTLQVLAVQELIDESIRRSRIVVEVDTMSRVWLNDSTEVLRRDIGEVHLRLSWNGGCCTTSSETITSAIWKIRIYNCQ